MSRQMRQDYNSFTESLDEALDVTEYVKTQVNKKAIQSMKKSASSNLLSKLK
jgi:hypothetical protein